MKIKEDSRVIGPEYSEVIWTHDVRNRGGRLKKKAKPINGAEPLKAQNAKKKKKRGRWSYRKKLA